MLRYRAHGFLPVRALGHTTHREAFWTFGAAPVYGETPTAQGIFWTNCIGEHRCAAGAGLLLKLAGELCEARSLGSLTPPFSVSGIPQTWTQTKQARACSC